MRQNGSEPVCSFWEILENLQVGIILVGSDRRIVYVNASVPLLTGYAGNELLGTSCWELFRPLKNDGNLLTDDDHCPILACWSEGKHHQLETFFHHRDGHLIPVMVSANALGGAHMAAMVEITEGISRLPDIYPSPMLDHLTGLSNRFYLESTIERQLTELKRHGWNFGILFIDIDGFKAINDTYGHATGDLFLIAIGTTLLNCLRLHDVIGRWGGDEFLAVLPNVGPSDLSEVAERYRLLVQETILPIGEKKLHVTVSVGGTVATPEDTVETLVTSADFLMYNSKTTGKNRVTLDTKEVESRDRCTPRQPSLFPLYG